MGPARDRGRARGRLGRGGALRRGPLGRRRGGAVHRGARSGLRGAGPRGASASRRGSRGVGKRPGEAPHEGRRPALARLRKRLAEVAAIDFFGAARPRAVEGLLAALEAAPAAGGRGPRTTPRRRLAEVRGRTWVTRTRRPRRPHRQRLADPALHRSRGALQVRPRPGVRARAGRAALRHVRGASSPTRATSCTFEVLLRRFGLADPALRQIAEIVHDIDLKDGQVRAGRRPRASTA